MQQPPNGLTFEATQDGFVIKTKLGSWLQWVLVGLGIVMTGTGLTIAFLWRKGRADLPFVLGPVTASLLAASVLTFILSGMALTKQGDEVRVFRGFKSFGYTRRFRWADVEAIDEITRRTKQGKELLIRVVFKPGTRRRFLFGSMLTAPQRAFILATLQQHLAISRR